MCAVQWDAGVGPKVCVFRGGMPHSVRSEKRTRLDCCLLLSRQQQFPSASDPLMCLSRHKIPARTRTHGSWMDGPRTAQTGTSLSRLLGIARAHALCGSLQVGSGRVGSGQVTSLNSALVSGGGMMRARTSCRRITMDQFF